MARKVFFSQLETVINDRIRKNLNVGNAHDDYVTKFLYVCTYVAAVNKSTLPVLLKAPKQWDDYVTAFTGAKSDALAWTNNVVAKLKQLPETIIADNKMVLDLFANAMSRCDILINDGTDEFSKNKLKSYIANGSSEVDELVKLIGNVIELLEKFNSTLPVQADNLQKIAAMALADEKLDKQKIADLESDIDEMEQEIKSLTAAIIALGIADGIALILSVIAVVAAGPAGALTWIFTGAIIAVATAYIALDAMKIKELKAKIASKQAEMSAYEKDITALLQTNKTFSDLAKQAASMTETLKYILNVWQTLSSDLGKIETEIESAGVSYTAEDWQSIKSDFQNANDLWNTFIEQVKVYKLDISANTGQLTPGMSSEDVEQAVKAGTNMDIIDYLNQAG